MQEEGRTEIQLRELESIFRTVFLSNFSFAIIFQTFTTFTVKSDSALFSFLNLKIEQESGIHNNISVVQN